MTNYSVGSGNRAEQQQSNRAAAERTQQNKNLFFPVIYKVSGSIFKYLGARATEDERLPHSTICICDVSGQVVDPGLITR